MAPPPLWRLAKEGRIGKVGHKECHKLRKTIVIIFEGEDSLGQGSRREQQRLK